MDSLKEGSDNSPVTAGTSTITAPSSSSSSVRTIIERNLFNSENEKVVLKDFFIEHSFDDGGRHVPETLSLSVFGLEDDEDEDAARTEKISAALWKYDRVIQLHPDIGDLTFVAQSEEVGDLGFLFLTRDDMLAFLTVGYDLKLDRSFAMEDGVHGTLKMSFSIATVSDFLSSFTTQELSEMQTNSFSFSEQPASLNALGNRLMQQFATSNNIHDIGQAFSAYHRAVQLTEPDNTRYAEYVCDAASALFRRFGLTANQSDIDQAISMMDVGVACTPKSDVNFPGRLINLGSLYRTRFEHEGDPRDIERGVEYQRKGVEAHPQNHPAWLSGLAHSYRMSFECTGRSEDAEKAILYHQIALQRTPKGSPDFALRLSDLGTSFRIRFQHTKGRQDIESAICNQQMAIQCAADSNFVQPRLFNNLGNTFQSRFEVAQDMSDIDSALANHRKAAKLLPDDNTDLPTFLNNLGTSLLMRFERHGDIEDVENSISHLERAVERTQERHPSRPGLLTNLGNSFLSQFRHTGNLQHLDNAIAHHDRAVQLAPSKHANLPGLLRNLGRSLATRYASTGDPKDISNAISYQERAVALTPEGHTSSLNQLSDLGNRYLTPTASTLLANLASSFSARFWRTEDLDDIKNAIFHQQQAVKLTPADHANFPMLLNNLGNAFLTRFKWMGDTTDLEHAISNHQMAVQLIPNTHVELPDADGAISNQRMAVQMTAEGHAERAIRLYNLATSLHSRFDVTKDPEDLREAIDMACMAAKERSGHPNIRLAAARSWAELCQQADRSSESMEAFQAALGLLSQVVGLEQTISRRHKNLVEVSDLTASATAAAVENKEVVTALGWLEQGRCLVWNQINQLRTPVDILRAYDPTLADRVLHVARALEASGYRHQQQYLEAITHETIAIQD
ncbi:unnamed protein product [Cyclocybe aegerita]|uniref:TPR-like protein n=1 Tax=Cyclocybe aegerita TaxID=1973307 RepID=A0A8S0W034_CYCAE|nr:unnamed protein product [Cyclocybe aegerita]